MSQQKQCLRCGELLDSEVRFCTRCGADQYAAPGAPGAGPAGPQGPYETPGQGYAPQGRVAPPKNYFIESILSTICCCLPLGIVAIVFAAKVEGQANRGDYKGAVESANKAKLFVILAIVIGLVSNIGYGIYMWPQVMKEVEAEMKKQEQLNQPPNIQLPPE